MAATSKMLALRLLQCCLTFLFGPGIHLCGDCAWLNLATWNRLQGDVSTAVSSIAPGSHIFRLQAGDGLVANTLDLMSGMLKRPGKFSRNLLLDLAPLVCSNAIQACTGNYSVFSFPLHRSNYIQINGAPFLVRLRGPLAFYCRKAVLT